MVLCYLILVHLISYYDIIIVNNNIVCNWAIYMLFMILHVFVDNCSLLHINWTFPIIICKDVGHSEYIYNQITLIL